MPTVNKSLIVPYSVEQMYNLVNAIESYPEFLPWCKSTEIHTRSDNELKATIQLSKGPMTYSITTENQMQPHERISMQYIDGPFRHCSGTWEFKPTDKAQETLVTFNMDYQFANRLAAIAIEPVFNPISNSLIDAFYKRAEQIYGKA